RKPISNMDRQSLWGVDSVFVSALTSSVSPCLSSTAGLSSSFIDLRKPLIASPTSDPMPFSRLVPNNRMTISRMIASCQILIPPKPISTSRGYALLVCPRCFLAQAGSVEAPFQFLQNIIRSQAQVTEHDQSMKPQKRWFRNQYGVVVAELTILGGQKGFGAFLADVLQDVKQAAGMPAGHVGAVCARLFALLQDLGQAR